MADAGADQTAFVGDTVTLDGSGSSDVDGNALSFQWSLTTVPTGSAAALSDPTAVMPTFDVDVFGQYVAQLIVNDGSVDSLADTVTISTENSAPVADAGANQTVFVGDTVTLDGSASSDVDGDALTYRWSLTTVPAGSAAVLSDATAVMPTFDVDVFGQYVAQLIVNDGSVDSLADTVVIIAEEPAVGQPPEAPSNLISGARAQYVYVAWSSSDGADSYSVYRRLNTESSFTRLGSTESPGYADVLPASAGSATYYVTAENQIGSSAPSTAVTVSVGLRRRR